ncbi:hypothetical protein [Devosia sp.]|uniref:hypothetical protein n=1 Tax=Devosia sp. TaxID=1871048 RepID=UPI0025E92F14|nr:hypothetical protein [Devosia sp.]MCR6637375.1 hypothetical protein [Devosia sp.]
MVFGNLEREIMSRDSLTPMQIAQHSLFTAREKLDLLHQLRADASGAEAEGRGFGFTSGEIDEAIAHVHRGVQHGVGTQTVFKGDY